MQSIQSSYNNVKGDVDAMPLSKPTQALYRADDTEDVAGCVGRVLASQSTGPRVAFVGFVAAVNIPKIESL